MISEPALSAPPILHDIVAQHLEEVISLRKRRSTLLRAPHVGLFELGQADERLAAHLDGLAVAGDAAWGILQAGIEEDGAAAVFAAMVLAVQRQDPDRLHGLAAQHAHTSAAHFKALVSALGWAQAAELRGLLGPMLTGATPVLRRLGIAACGAHGVDPGAPLVAAFSDPDLALCTQALRTATTALGATRFLPQCLALVTHADDTVAWHAAAGALLLGDRHQALAHLRQLALQDGPFQDDSLMLVLRATPYADAHQMLERLARQGAPTRQVIQACAWAGAAQAVPWLMTQFDEPHLARVAAEAFSVITGADLVLLGLDAAPPVGFAAGPNDDTADDDVGLPEDDNLPWPDADKTGAWWQLHSHRMPLGTHLFFGAKPTPAHCQHVLKTGHQRARRAAALWASIGAPGTARFNTSAPANRQAKLLFA